ncbi:uncharacterized protein LOC126282415 [Schistocerca gregaria]|uniref:uncharacterized protein LOC126282415 n=1 Tax=Schistocerca gregaria TaxID=7010 RepID=UPI00211E9955|nr:uncharacterized protein LOC126282415 [Schistocerca gregaria]
MKNYVNRRQLEDDAIPTVFGFATHLKKVTKARKPPKPKPRNVETAENVCVDVHVSGYTGDHNYSFPSSPSKLKEKFEKIEERKEAKIGQYKTKLNTVNKKRKRQTQKIGKLANILELKAKNLVNDKLLLLKTKQRSAGRPGGESGNCTAQGGVLPPLPLPSPSPSHGDELFLRGASRELRCNFLGPL